MANITRCKVSMYRAGTGDCFLLQFTYRNSVKFKMLIDAGSWNISGDYLDHFVTDLKERTEGKIDLLVVTHEHTDHVLMFERSKEIFKTFEIKECWMGWTEKEGDPKVEQWKKKYGEKKKALWESANKINKIVEDEDFKNAFKGARAYKDMLDSRLQFSSVLSGFAELHANALGVDKVYKGSLGGMEVVKKDLNIGKFRYFEQGAIEEIDELPGIRFYVLGPPNLYDEVKEESGGEDESYDHNKDLDEGELFSIAVNTDSSKLIPEHLLAFDRAYFADVDLEEEEKETIQNITNTSYEAWNDIKGLRKIVKLDISQDSRKLNPEKLLLDSPKISDINHSNYYHYKLKGEDWRNIDHDWLFSSGGLALRMNSLTNNLSLALAIEFVDSGRVMLFPGDAEFGSWQSWHKINWKVDRKEGEKHLTEDLLNRTVFYKVAHHLSHNGTAKSLGLDMMTHRDLTAMATLDYNVISKGWMSTMPNRAIVKDLLDKTDGRLIILNEEGLSYDFDGNITMSDKIKEARQQMSKTAREEFEKSVYDEGTKKDITYDRGGEEITETQKVLYYEYEVVGRK